MKSVKYHHDRFITCFPCSSTACIRAAEIIVSLGIFSERLRIFQIAYRPEISQLLNLADGSREEALLMPLKASVEPLIIDPISEHRLCRKHPQQRLCRAIASSANSPTYTAGLWSWYVHETILSKTNESKMKNNKTKTMNNITSR